MRRSAGIVIVVLLFCVQGREARALTEMIKDINSLGGTQAYPYGFADVDGTLFVGATDLAHGRELWKSDGSEEGTVIVEMPWDPRAGYRATSPT